jgi:hypothetical protein
MTNLKATSRAQIEHIRAVIYNTLGTVEAVEGYDFDIDVIPAKITEAIKDILIEAPQCFTKTGSFNGKTCTVYQAIFADEMGGMMMIPDISVFEDGTGMFFCICDDDEECAPDWLQDFTLIEQVAA